jgi:GNAT superfamily N-acetyltransferase
MARDPNGDRPARRSGIRQSFDRLIYSLYRRIGVADRSLLMCCDTQHLSGYETQFDEKIAVSSLPLEDIYQLAACNHDFESEAFQSLDPQRFRCFVIRVDEQIAAYAWIGLGNIPAEHNCNGHPWTGLPIALDAKTAYLFAAFVADQYRGQRLYQFLMSRVSSLLLSEGILQVALTTDIKNDSAIRAVQRMGFAICGESRFTSVLGWKRAAYSVGACFEPNKLGRYVGDCISYHESGMCHIAAHRECTCGILFRFLILRRLP